MDRPKLIVHNLASVDGRLTLAPDVLLLYGDARWSAVAGDSDEVYRRIMSAYQPQAILEGSGSLVLPGQAVEPLPPAAGDAGELYTDFLPEAVVDQPGRKWLAVVDGGGRIRWMYKEFPGETWAGWHVLALVSRSTPPEYLAYLRGENIPYLVAGEGRVDLAEALGKLKADLHVDCAVSTGGGKLNGALLRLGLIDEIDLEFFPAVIGGIGTPALFDAPALKPDENPTRLELLECRALPGGAVRLHYRACREGE